MKKKNWFADTEAYLIFDDTLINNKKVLDPLKLVKKVKVATLGKVYQ